MSKTDLLKIERVVKEIIEILEEEMPDDKESPLCANNRNSPFNQLIGLLEMELAAAKIMYSDEPLEQETSLPTSKKNILPEKKQKATLNGSLPEKSTPVLAKSVELKAEQPNQAATAAENVIKHVEPDDKPESNRFNYWAAVMLAACGSAVLSGLIVWFVMCSDTSPAEGKLVVNWHDIEQGKLSSVELKNKVNQQNKNSAISFYTLGKKEFEKNNFKAAREYFRTAVAVDPSNEEYISAYRLAEFSLQRQRHKADSH